MCFNYADGYLVQLTKCRALLQVHPICATTIQPSTYHSTTWILIYVTNGGIYLYTYVCVYVKECSPIIINIIICTNPKTMTFSACGRGSSTTATLSFALPLPHNQRRAMNGNNAVASIPHYPIKKIKKYS